MIPKLFSDKFLKKVEQLGISIPELLGFSKSRLTFYPFITGKGLQDIRTVFKQTKEEDMELVDYYSEYIDPDSSTMEKARVIAKEINSRTLYATDSANFSKAEYWKRPIEVHRNRRDDCDGYAVLICYLLRLFGAKDYEVFVSAGWVQALNSPELIGHAYVLVLDITSMLFFPLEGSFYGRKTLEEFGNIPFHQNTRYKDIWWITNDKVSYSNFPILRFIK